MITFRVDDMRFEYHSPNVVPFPEFVLDACDLVHDWTYTSGDKLVSGLSKKKSTSQVSFKVENQQYVYVSNFHKETLGEFILKVAIEDTLEGEIHNDV